jgi:hypothetical protein
MSKTKWVGQVSKASGYGRCRKPVVRQSPASVPILPYRDDSGRPVLGSTHAHRVKEDRAKTVAPENASLQNIYLFNYTPIPENVKKMFCSIAHLISITEKIVKSSQQRPHRWLELHTGKPRRDRPSGLRRGLARVQGSVGCEPTQALGSE